ncbi:CBS domain-containing protein [Halapricum hydrolyticum]|uniref:CBS domain-containing protein n=1 Tax=Halapricum hydrolyticum TaxID=2979991 RepID=A0AAE3I8X1_9EURY|nr:CBS domain-containing protein [Halapricum hydrolyticum]MCU4717035.1 CBS domain-containing protein [Halapricum hydrolyticum]MCU4725961.1 CBS domain-containing protein [Halapricum hydrolyticum]
MVTAREIMTSPVETVAPDDDVSDVLTRLAKADFSGFPVVEEGQVVGIVTETDLVDLFQPSDRRLWIPVGFPPFIETMTYSVDLSWSDLDVGVDMVKNAGKPIRDVMVTDVVTVSPEDTVETVIDHLADPDRDINRLPVVEDGELVGIISREDVLRTLSEHDVSV